MERVSPGDSETSADAPRFSTSDASQITTGQIREIAAAAEKGQMVKSTNH